MTRIKRNGLTQYVRTRATATDYTAFTGENDGDALPGVSLVFSENKATGWEDTEIESPSVLWNAVVGIWEAAIPASYITQDGDATLLISGTGMVSVLLYLEVGNTGGSGGMGQVLLSTEYDFDASAKTIALLGSYVDTELPQIISIKNVTKGLMTIYDCTNPATAISYTAPTISWAPDFVCKGTVFEDTDELQIIINKTL